MSLVEEKLTRDKFRELYQDCKPSWELIDGCAEQKALGSKPHSYLQVILAGMLKQLGFRVGVELTLEISETWEPVPDVVGALGPKTQEAYQSRPPAVVIEILSPSDRFTQLDRKCRRYAEWDVADILVFDPGARRAWHWDRQLDGLRPVQKTYAFSSKPGATLSIAEAFRQLDEW